MWDKHVVNFISTIKTKKVDSKGRVILPEKDLQEVFMTEMNDLILVSKSEEKIKSAIQAFTEFEKQKKIQALSEWEEALEEADMLDIGNDQIDRATLKKQQEKLRK